jgi:hypothetical protein
MQRGTVSKVLRVLVLLVAVVVIRNAKVEAQGEYCMGWCYQYCDGLCSLAGRACVPGAHGYEDLNQPSGCGCDFSCSGGGSGGGGGCGDGCSEWCPSQCY